MNKMHRAYSDRELASSQLVWGEVIGNMLVEVPSGSGDEHVALTFINGLYWQRLEKYIPGINDLGELTSHYRGSYSPRTLAEVLSSIDQLTEVHLLYWYGSGPGLQDLWFVELIDGHLLEISCQKAESLEKICAYLETLGFEINKFAELR